MIAVTLRRTQTDTLLVLQEAPCGTCMDLRVLGSQATSLRADAGPVRVMACSSIQR
jgi:hypothetical protein